MRDYNTMPAAGHRLELVGREHLTVTGVEDVERFDESTIVLSTAQGGLEGQGEGLHIETLSLDGGDLKVEGWINALIYEPQGQMRGGFFSRLFRGSFRFLDHTADAANRGEQHARQNR